MVKPSKGKLLYHITHLENMKSILQQGLVPRKTLEQQGIRYLDIADPGIIKDRGHYMVDLAEYVPFHFFVKNPFDGAVCKKYGAENMVILAIQREDHEKNKFSIIPAHPLGREQPEILPYETGFDRVRWDILDAEYRDYHDPEVKRACMAECVVPYPVPPQAFFRVFVKTPGARDHILRLDRSDVIKNRLEVAPYMFP